MSHRTRTTEGLSNKLNTSINHLTDLFNNLPASHIRQEFWQFVVKEYPNVFLIYVPINCAWLSSHLCKLTEILHIGTGIFQPADVGLQRILKHYLHQCALEFFVECHSCQIDNGITPKHIKFTTSLPVLRNASGSPIVALHNYLLSSIGEKIVQKVSSYSKHCAAMN